jgi:alkylated DNA repair dioxygenase AlkB
LTLFVTHGMLELMFAVSWQASLFGFDAPSIDPSMTGVRRHWVDDTSWIDHLPRWLGGFDDLFAGLVARTPWRQRRVPMYDRMVDEPRLTWSWSDPDDGVPPPILTTMQEALSRHYARPFDSISLNFYRHGRDSVAWHRDRVRNDQTDPIVVIVSVGAPRPFLVRRHGGGPSQAYLLGQGDLFVMGGAFQHDWEHTVPKVAAAGPRISITYRHG